MNHADCENLDGFLSGELSAGEAPYFAAHLVECERCRETVDQQRWIDGLLRSPIAAEVEAPPEMILTCVASRAVRRRRQIRLIAGGLAVAAAIAIGVGWTVKLNRQASDPTGVTIDDLAETKPHESSISVLPRATFVGGPDVLVVPVESRHPNVTIVRIYPDYQPDLGAQANAEVPAIGDEFVLPFERNGG